MPFVLFLKVLTKRIQEVTNRKQRFTCENVVLVYCRVTFEPTEIDTSSS